MKRNLFGLAGVLLLTLTSTAFAKNVCVQSSGGIDLVFLKVKSLTSPGKFSPLHGVASPNCPMTGTAYVDSGGTVHFDVHIGCLQETGLAISYGWTGDATFAGSGQIDSSPEDGNPDGARTFTPIDCRMLTLPLLPVGPSDTVP